MIWSAFLLGLLGSFHCVGMCGPIALALPSKDPIKLLIYNGGRSITYGFLGGLIGAVGLMLPFADIQQILSMTAGSIILIYLAFYITRTRLAIDILFSRVSTYFIKSSKGLFKKDNPFTNFIIGLANGFLPCGLVYMGLVGALATGNLSEGALYMIVFGIGTIPVMLILSLSGRLLSIRFRQTINKLIPLFLLVIAILFILRGLNLGIPFVSPKLDKNEVTQNQLIIG